MSDDRDGSVFYPEEAPSREQLDGSESIRDKYRRLADNYRPGKSGKWHDEVPKIDDDRAAVVDAVAGQLELTPGQRDRARAKISNLPGRHFRANQIALVALVVCGWIGWRDGRNYHPNGTLPAHFRSAMGDLSLSRKAYKACWGRVVGDLK